MNTPGDELELPKGYDAADLLADGARAEDMEKLQANMYSAPEAPAATPSSSRRSSTFHGQLIDALDEFLGQARLLPDAVGGWLRADTHTPTGCDTGELVLDFLLERRHQWSHLARGYVEETLSALVKTRRARRRAELIATITGKPATEAGRRALMQWVGAVTGLTAAADADGQKRFVECYTVMMHWIWLIKRMALGQRTEHDLMPIVFGPQGSGKSTATERLCEPLAELASAMNASNLTDERKFRALGRCLVGRWEEMQGAQKGDIEALKNTITARSIGYRRLNTHDNEVLLRSCGFIGTSNHPVDVMIADTTGARRFYQLTTPAVIDRAAINSCPAADLWLAVSESDAAPILPVLDQIRIVQADLVQKDAVTLWLESEEWDVLHLISPDTHTDTVLPAYNHERGEPFEHLAIRFKHWCLRVGQAANNVRGFSQRLQQEGFTTTRPRAATGGLRPRRYHRPERSETLVGAGTATHAAELAERGRKLRLEPSPAEDRFISDHEGATDGEMPFGEPPL